MMMTVSRDNDNDNVANDDKEIGREGGSCGERVEVL